MLLQRSQAFRHEVSVQDPADVEDNKYVRIAFLMSNSQQLGIHLRGVLVIFSLHNVHQTVCITACH
uniref:Uncharacterized protein n=1 Tax=Anguilla anguilla TaxID=7936 RepID=A0A0E9R1H8_ANGAN